MEEFKARPLKYGAAAAPLSAQTVFARYCLKIIKEKLFSGD